MQKRLFALGAVLMVSAGLAQGIEEKESVHASLGASYSRALTSPETLNAIRDNPEVCVPEAIEPVADLIVGGIAFGVFTALEDQLPLTQFMKKQGRVPRSYATPWGCSYSKPMCGLRGLMDQWNALYETSLVPSAGGEFSTIQSVDIGIVNNGISWTCADAPEEQFAMLINDTADPEEQFLILIKDIANVVAEIQEKTPGVQILIATYPKVDNAQLQALVNAKVGKDEVPVTQLTYVAQYDDWRASYREKVCDLASNDPHDPQVRVLYPWGFKKGGTEDAVKFKEFQLGFLGFHPEDKYMKRYADAIGNTLKMSNRKWARAKMNACK